MRLEEYQARLAAELSGPSATLAHPRYLLGEAADRRGLALYRRNVHDRWHDALASQYPVARMLVGEEFFRGMALAYAQEERPDPDCDMTTLGRDFPVFVSRFAPARALPYLADVARLEWSVHRGRHAADDAEIDRQALLDLSPKALLSARFAIGSSCFLESSPFPVGTIWMAHQPGSGVDFPSSLDVRENMLVARRSWSPCVVLLADASFCMLGALVAGDTVERALQGALEQDPAFDLPGALVSWLELGVLAGIRTTG